MWSNKADIAKLEDSLFLLQTYIVILFILVNCVPVCNVN